MTVCSNCCPLWHFNHFLMLVYQDIYIERCCRSTIRVWRRTKSTGQNISCEFIVTIRAGLMVWNSINFQFKFRFSFSLSICRYVCPSKLKEIIYLQPTTRITWQHQTFRHKPRNQTSKYTFKKWDHFLIFIIGFPSVDNRTRSGLLICIYLPTFLLWIVETTKKGSSWSFFLSPLFFLYQITMQHKCCILCLICDNLTYCILVIVKERHQKEQTGTLEFRIHTSKVCKSNNNAQRYHVSISLYIIHLSQVVIWNYF